jgi:hypothetical protein
MQALAYAVPTATSKALRNFLIVSSRAPVAKSSQLALNEMGLSRSMPGGRPENPYVPRIELPSWLRIRHWPFDEP